MIRFQFKVYGLDVLLNLTAGSNKYELVAAMKGCVIQFGETVAIAHDSSIPFECGDTLLLLCHPRIIPLQEEKPVWRNSK